MRFASIALTALLVLAGCTGGAPATENPSTVVALGSSTPAASASAATSTPTAAPSSSASIDLSTVDACSLLEQSTVREITGTSLDFETSDRPSTASQASCFWGARVPGEPAYVELTIFKRPSLAGYNFQPGQGCTSGPVSVDPSIEAVGGTCTDPQTKVFLLLADGGLALSMLVNEPDRQLTPTDLGDTLRSTLNDVLQG